MSGKSSSVLSVIEVHLQTDAPLTIASLGGLKSLMNQADILVAAPYLDVIAQLTSNSSPEDSSELDKLLLRGFAEGQDPSALRAATDTVIHDIALRSRVRTQLAGVLEKRIEMQSTTKQALVAAYSLEALFRLALTGAISKFIPLKILACITPSADGLFAQHAAKLAGAAFHIWAEDDLLTTLDNLRKVEDAEGEASFELALARISQALNSEVYDQVLMYLDTAKGLLRDARLADEDRADAAAYEAVIDIIQGFSIGTAEHLISGSVDILIQSVSDHNRQLGNQLLPEWLVGRMDREIQWVRLTRSVQQAAKDLKRPSWLKAWSVIENLLAVYDADRSLSTMGGLGQLLRPRIESSFVKERGQLAHLDDLLSGSNWDPDQQSTASALRHRVTQMSEINASLDGLMKEGNYPILCELLRSTELPSEWSAEALRTVETALSQRRFNTRDISNPIVQRLLKNTSDNLGRCQDYEGEVRDHFDELLLQVLLFCHNRQDAGLKELQELGQYLRDPDATEFNLQRDLWQWLCGNYPHADIKTEVEGVATGRADIYVTFGAFRIVFEMKRHHGHLDRTSAKSYCNQAVSYQNTNVKLGFLGVLEIAERNGPPPSLEECVWYESVVPKGSEIVRHLVVFRVPGNLKPPSSMSPKTQKPRKKKPQVQAAPQLPD